MAIDPDYDGYWKEIITTLFEDFVQYFLPDVYQEADFSQPPVFLEQELQKLIADKRKKGKIFNDKLVRIILKDGSQQWLLIHIEVQSYAEADFVERMFSYFYRIYDKYGSQITAIAIYTDDRKDITDTFSYQLFGTEVTYRFNAFSVQQFDEKELLASDNPFALALLAGKYHLRTHQDAEKRYSFKRKLVTLAWEKNYDRTKVVALLRFVHLIISLPETLETQFEQEFVKRLINEQEMELTKSQKRIAHTVYEAVYGESLESGTGK
ncbi:hypothetical protein [Tunicatimonas pelagia]|uniref:hypothetical protein n=1 Tax=Tunicatimonas pelagia TaxID=931531 RepID=UPI0026669F21|nr:hypothetical protein [Tunicatimonas pelagia]WKN45530.1 hypothetical protein P0M28_11235 [Tunicatimonas pelagia]